MSNIKDIKTEKLQKQIHFNNTLFGSIGIISSFPIIDYGKLINMMNNIKSNIIYSVKPSNDITNNVIENYNLSNSYCFMYGYTLLLGSTTLFMYGIYNLFIKKNTTNTIN
jgi:hypothetical protein